MPAIVSLFMPYSICRAFYVDIFKVVCLGQLEAFDFLGLVTDVIGIVFRCLCYTCCRISPPPLWVDTAAILTVLLAAAFALFVVLVVPLPFAIVFLFFYIAKIIKIIQIVSRLLIIY